MIVYADRTFYESEYNGGATPKIESKEFPRFSILASAEIRRYTFRRVDEMESIPEEVKYCCCEIAEKLYDFEHAKGSSGMVLQSYSNDGDTGTYKTDDMTENAIKQAIYEIVHKWLSCTGLMYCGVN